MNAVRESWTDERLDDFRGEVKEGFGRADKRFDRVDGQIKDFRREMRNEFGSVRGETKGEFVSMRGEMGEGFKAVAESFEKMNARFDSMYRAMIGLAVAIIVALIGAAKFL
jgi:uncharacterized protein YjbJ (UPF0337 family)